MCPDAVTPTILFALDSFTGNVPENPKCLWGGAGLEIDVTILLKLWTFYFGGGGGMGGGSSSFSVHFPPHPLFNVTANYQL